MGWVFLQFVSQLTHVDPEIMPFLHVQGPPDFFQELPVSQHLAGIPDQGREQLVFNRREMNFLFRNKDQSASQVHLEISECKYRLSAIRPRSGGIAKSCSN